MGFCGITPFAGMAVLSADDVVTFCSSRLIKGPSAGSSLTQDPSGTSSRQNHYGVIIHNELMGPFIIKVKGFGLSMSIDRLIGRQGEMARTEEGAIHRQFLGKWAIPSWTMPGRLSSYDGPESRPWQRSSSADDCCTTIGVDRENRSDSCGPPWPSVLSPC
jgi:hypothetical protein